MSERDVGYLDLLEACTAFLNAMETPRDRGYEVKLAEAYRVTRAAVAKILGERPR